MSRLFSVRPRPILRTFLFAASCALLLAVASASAQTVTTGSLSGVVTDSQGGVLPGATVQAVHTPTGTKYETVTDAQGRYNILNVRVGPYDLSASMASFRDESQAGIDVKLGEQKAVDFRMQLATVSETVEVTVFTSLIDSSRPGTADSVSQQMVENLPTISRNMSDIARTSPYFNPIGAERGSAGALGGGPEQPL